MSEDGNTFPAEAIPAQDPNHRIAGRIVLDRFRMRFVSSTVHLEFPLAQLEIQADESGGYRFANRLQSDWLICVSDPLILRHPSLLQQPATRNQIRAFDSPRELKKSLVITLGVLGGFVLLALFVTLLSGIFVGVLLARIPPQWEQKVGDDLMAELKKTEIIVQDPKLKTKLDRAVMPLVKSLPGSPIQYQFYIIDEPMPNAFALPGGHVLVTTRLLEMADRPEEIAGVVAHELAHVLKKHGFRKIISSLGPFLIFRVFLGNSAGVLPILGDSSELLVRQSFSQTYELEADQVGWNYLVRAQIDPRGLTDMLRKFDLEQKRLLPGMPHFTTFSSHPATEKRIRKLDEQWDKLKNKTGFIQL